MSTAARIIGRRSVSNMRNGDGNSGSDMHIERNMNTVTNKNMNQSDDNKLKDNNDDDMEIQNLCKVFSSTMSSLSKDANTLKVLASYHALTVTAMKMNQMKRMKIDVNRDGDGDENENENSNGGENDDEENIHPNTNTNTNTNIKRSHKRNQDEDADEDEDTELKLKLQKQLQLQQKMAQQWNDLHQIVSNLESKVSVIRHALDQEQQAMETLRGHQTQTILKQKMKIQEIRDNIQEQNLKLDMDMNMNMNWNSNVRRGREVGRNKGHTSSSSSSSSSSSAWHPKNNSTNQRPSSAPASASASTVRTRPLRLLDHPPNNHHGQRPSPSQSHQNQVQTQTQMPHIQIKIRPITAMEFQTISKNIRGTRRIKLSELNGALSDIQHVLMEKYKHSHHHDDSYSYMHTYMHMYTPFASEQELRNACAFFRSGESTARAILQILRHVKRIKQLYICSNSHSHGHGRSRSSSHSNISNLEQPQQVTYVWLN